MDIVGDILFWVIGAAIAVALALGILWLVFAIVTRIKPKDRQGP